MTATSDRYGCIKQLFNDVCDLPDAPAQCAALRAQGVDDATLAEVMQLLGHANGVTHFAVPVAAAAQQWLGSELKAGDRLGSWTLTGTLGQGGMGRVFLAARSDGHYEQRAAIKLLLGWSGPDALARVTRERQILASLNHPNIAQLIDGGSTPAGQPFLVMEFADGLAIDVYCASNRLMLKARLELFQNVCDAVAHAHRQLVIHCDIKPSNVVVNADGRPKLLDFGIARLEGQDKDGAPALTPGYASPEQMAGQALGIASDIYSLGRLLEELLEPLAATHRRGFELAAVVARATAYVPEQRYTSVGALQRDLLRLLVHLPLEALPPTATYACGKLLRRRWPWALAGGAALVLGAAFTIVLTLQRDRALLAEEQMRQAARRALFSEQVAREAEYQAQQGARRAQLSAQVARDAEEQARQSETAARRAEAHARVDVARAIVAEGDAQRQRDLLRTANLEGEAHRELAVLEARRAKMGAQVQRETSRLLMSLFTGIDPRLAGVPEVHESLLAGDGRDRLSQAMNADAGTRARLQMALGDVYERIGRSGEAIASYAEAAGLFGSEQLGQPLAEAEALRRLAMAYDRSGQFELAEAPARRALALRVDGDSKSLPDIADAEASLGVVLIGLHRYGEADQRIGHALRLHMQDAGADDPSTSSTLHELARLNRSRGKPALAESQLSNVIAVERRTLGPLDGRTLRALEDYGLVLSDLQRHGDAERNLREAVQGWTTVFGADSGNVAAARQRLGRILREAGRLDAALLELTAALEIETTHVAASTPRAASMRMDLALVHEAAGRLGQAEVQWRRAVVDLHDGPGVPALTLAAARHGLAHTLWLMARPDAAQLVLAPALAVRTQRLPSDSDELLQSRMLAAELALAQLPGPRAAATGDPSLAVHLLAQIDDIGARVPAAQSGLQFDLLALRGHFAAQGGRQLEAAQWLSAAWRGQLAWRGFAHPGLLPLGLDLRAALDASGQRADALALKPALETCAQAIAPESEWRQRLAVAPGSP